MNQANQSIVKGAAGFSLDRSSQTIYVFAPTSKHENQIVVHITNPLPKEIPYSGQEVIEVAVMTANAGVGNSNALTTPDEIDRMVLQQVVKDATGAWTPVSNPNWVMQPIHHDETRCVFRLLPSPTNPPIFVLRDQGILSISLDHVVTSLGGQVGQMDMAAHNFTGLDPLSVGSCSINIEPYPEPQGNLHPVLDQESGTPLIASWSVAYADRLNLRYTDSLGNVTLHENVPSTAKAFEVRSSNNLAGWLEMEGVNDSNTIPWSSRQPVAVTGSFSVEGAIETDANGKFGASAPATQWSVSPSWLVKSMSGEWEPPKAIGVWAAQFSAILNVADIPSIMWEAGLVIPNNPMKTMFIFGMSSNIKNSLHLDVDILPGPLASHHQSVSNTEAKLSLDTDATTNTGHYTFSVFKKPYRLQAGPFPPPFAPFSGKFGRSG